MRNSTTLRFGFEFEATYGLDAVHYFTAFIDIFCAIPVHIWVLTIITLKPNVLQRDIRNGFMADQITMMLYGFVMCLLLKPYSTLPWPGYYCAGIICQMNLSTQIISASLGATYSSVVPFFCYLMIRLHNQVTIGSDTRFNIRGRLQTSIMLAIIALLCSNTICFGLFAVNGENIGRLKEVGTPENMHETDCFPIPEIDMLASRTGTVVVIGLPGQAEYFQYEVALLFVTCFLVVLLLIFLTGHSLYIIYNRHKTSQLSVKTHQAQDRLTIVFFLQLIAVFVFFVVPMLTWVYLCTCDITSWSNGQLAFLRASIAICLSMKPLAQSLIFLRRNPALRQQSLNRIRKLFAKSSVGQAN